MWGKPKKTEDKATSELSEEELLREKLRLRNTYGTGMEDGR